MKLKLLLAATGIIVLGCLWLLLTPHKSLGLLAYVESGDVWIRDLPDRQLIRLTQDAHNSNPRISPSRKWLAFRKDDGQLWIMKINGESGRLICPEGVTYFKWAPGLDLIAFIAKGELRVLEAGKNESRLIVQGPSQEDPETGTCVEFLWSPDAKWIAYEYLQKLDSYWVVWPWSNSIRKVDVASGDSEIIIRYLRPMVKEFPATLLSPHGLEIESICGNARLCLLLLWPMEPLYIFSTLTKSKTW